MSDQNPSISLIAAGNARQGGSRRKRRALRFVGAARRTLGERLSLAVAASVFALPAAEIRRTTRAAARVARARQAGIYCACRVFSASFSRAGRIFGRDRTTARHACDMALARMASGGAESVLPLLAPALSSWVERFAEAAAAAAFE